ncbi:MAG: gliding motility protein GldM, partial [Petrimonas mucosa]
MVANSPNSPRQKMINLMYLVFIAMLALNVSADVLRGFDIIGDTLERSTEKMQAKNGSILKQLEN